MYITIFMCLVRLMQTVRVLLKYFCSILNQVYAFSLFGIGCDHLRLETSKAFFLDFAGSLSFMVDFLYL